MQYNWTYATNYADKNKNLNLKKNSVNKSIDAPEAQMQNEAKCQRRIGGKRKENGGWERGLK